MNEVWFLRLFFFPDMQQYIVFFILLFKLAKWLALKYVYDVHFDCIL